MKIFPDFRTIQLDIHLCSIFTTLTAKKYSTVIFHDSFQIKANAFITSKQHNFNCQLQFINKLWFGELHHFSLSVCWNAKTEEFLKEGKWLTLEVSCISKNSLQRDTFDRKKKIKKKPQTFAFIFFLQNFYLKSILLSNPQQEESWQTFLKHQGRLSHPFRQELPVLPPMVRSTH